MAMTPNQRSARSKRSWRSRKRQDEALGRGRQPVGYEAVVAATTPEKSSAAIAAELGVSAAYVRHVWRVVGLPRRPAGYWPPVRASTPRGGEGE